MDSNSIKNLFKKNHLNFFLAILISLIIHLFLLGGIDIYNPFFLTPSDNLNIVIESHLEEPRQAKIQTNIPEPLKPTLPKEKTKKNRQYKEDNPQIKDNALGDIKNNDSENSMYDSSNGEFKEIQYSKIIIDYDVKRSLDGNPVGVSRTEYTLDSDNHYSIKNEVEAKGFVSLFYWNKLVQTSDGLLTSEGLKPITYHYQFGSKIDNVAFFNWESRTIVTTANSKTNNFEMIDGSQDMLSFMYQFMFEPPLTKMKIYIANGKSYKSYDYAYINDELIEYETLKLETMHIAKYNYSNEERIDLWLAKDYRYIPVKIRKTEKDGSILEQIVKKIETESKGA